jgi:hypothetical protein
VCVVQCSLVECKSDDWNVKMVDQFHSKWGQLTTAPYECFYDPSPEPVQLNFTLLEVTTFTVAINAFIWPALCLTGGVVIWLGVCLGCCKIENKRRRMENTKYSM